MPPPVAASFHPIPSQPAHMQQQPDYVLVGSEHSLYTAKLRSYLLWRGVPFVEVTASAQLYKQLILPRTGVAFIPVLVLPDHTTVLQDTHAIITHIERQHQHHWQPQQQQQQPQHQHWQQQQQPFPMTGPLLPSSPQAALASLLLELYGDEWLLLPAMHYRWSFPQQRQRLLYQFGSTTNPTGSYKQQMLAGAKVAARFAGMLPGLGITADSIPTIEARFHWQLAVLQAHFQQHAYLLGSTQPSNADAGFIGPLLGHLYTDPVPACMLTCEAPLVADYIERLSGMHSRARVLDRVLQHGGGEVCVAAAASASGGTVVAAQPADDDGSRSGSGSGGSSSSASGGTVVGLEPQNPQAPATGALVLKLLVQRQPLQQQQQQQQQSPQRQQYRSNEAPTAAAVAHAGANGFEACEVPPAVLLLLHHMFLEQVPVITDTLHMLQRWQQQQQQLQAGGGSKQHAGPSSGFSSCGGSSSSIGSGDGGSNNNGSWLTVPRFLGTHAFNLYDPSTGQPIHPPSGPLTRMASSYTAWRAAQIVYSYQQLPAAGQQRVQQLLRAISAAGGSSTGSCCKGHTSSAAWPQAATATKPTAATAAGPQAAGDAPPAALGRVDALGAFDQMVQLVTSCGRIARRSNRVAVWCPADSSSSSSVACRL